MNNKTPSEPATAKFTYDFDLKYIGEEVSVLYKDSTNSGTRYQPDDNDTIYGVVVTGNTSVVNATVDDIAGDYNTAGKVSISDTSYKVAQEGKIVTNLVNVDTGAAWTTQTAGVSDIKALSKANGDTVKFVLDDQNEIVSVYVTTTDLYKVTAVSGSKVSISGIGTIDTAENGTSVYDGVAKDDVVAVTKLYQDKPADATFVIEKAEAVSGTVTAYNAKTITLEGTVYDVYNEANYKSGLTDDAVTKLSSDDLDKEFTLYLVNGYVRAVQKGSEDMNQYAIVVDKDDNGVLDSTFKEPKAELLFADGSKKTVILHKDSKIYSDNSVTTPTNTFKTLSDNVSDLEKNQIVKYAEMSNGQYKIEECGTYTKATGSETLYNKDTKAFLNGGSLTVTDGACVLFYNNGSELKVSNIRNLDTISATASMMYASVIDSNGKIVAAFVDYGKKVPGASDDTLYGIITSDGQVTSKNGDPYTMFTVWTGEETTVYVEGDTVSSPTKGALVSFDKSADDTYAQSDFTVLDGTSQGQAIAVSDYSEADQTITFANALKLEGGAYVEDGKTTKAIDEDAKIVYIDADNQTKGDDGMGITSFDGTTGYANALIVYEGGVDTNKIVAIIVNTNSDTDVLGNKTVASAFKITCASVDPLATNYVSSDATGEYVIGQEVKITVTAKTGGTITKGTEYTLTFSADASSIVDGLETNKTTVKATAQENGKVTFSMVAKGTGTLTPNNFA